MSLTVETVLGEEHLRELLSLLEAVLVDAREQPSPSVLHRRTSSLGVELAYAIYFADGAFCHELRLSERGAWMPTPLARVLLVLCELALELEGQPEHRQNPEGVFSLRFELSAEEHSTLVQHSPSSEGVAELLETALSEAHELDIEYLSEGFDAARAVQTEGTR